MIKGVTHVHTNLVSFRTFRYPLLPKAVSWLRLSFNVSYSKPALEPASKLATGEAGKEARLLAQELRPVLTFLAARVNERHLRLSLFFFE